MPLRHRCIRPWHIAQPVVSARVKKIKGTNLMPWLWPINLMARYRRHRGSSLRALENRVAELEQRLAVPDTSEIEDRATVSRNRQVQAKLLLDQGLGQAEVARRLNVSRQYIHQLVHKGH